MAKINQHPGAVFKKFVDDYQLTAAKVADDIQLSQSSIRLLIGGKLKISVPIALRLAKYFGNKPEFWIDIQNKYELADSAKNAKLSAVLKSISKVKKPAPAKKVAVKPAKGKAAVKKPAKPRAKKAAPPPSDLI
ncbi:MAG: HigA family addiction module antidote protein [Treponema sp.]|jgi:addiction module HigA family antidote|nr:HigA family addiction module antidote protein [Treponema sp.]